MRRQAPVSPVPIIKLEVMIMNRARTAFLTSCLLGMGLSAAQALSLEGTVSSVSPVNAQATLQANSRVGLFLLGPNGKPTLEVVSSPLKEGRFALTLPDKPLEERLLEQLTPDAVTWSGVVGTIKVAGTPKFGELRLYTYVDVNTSAKRDSSEGITETAAQLGRSSLVVIYLDGPGKVSADKGFEVNLKAGWNALSIEAGRTVKGTALEHVLNLELKPL